MHIERTTLMNISLRKQRFQTRTHLRQQYLNEPQSPAITNNRPHINIAQVLFKPCTTSLLSLLFTLVFLIQLPVGLSYLLPIASSKPIIRQKQLSPLTGDDAIGEFNLLTDDLIQSSSNCPHNVSHLDGFSIEDVAIPHSTMYMGTEECNDGNSTVIHGTDTGAASAAVEEDAKILVNTIIESELAFWFASEPNGRICGPVDRFRANTIIAFVLNDRNDDEVVQINNVVIQKDYVYMMTSSLDEQCYYSKLKITTSSTFASLPPSALPSLSDSAMVPDITPLVNPDDDAVDEEEQQDNVDDSTDTTDPDDNSNSIFNPTPSAAAASTLRPPTFAAPTATPDADSEDEGGASCFPGWVKVTLCTGERKAMKDLDIGDSIRVNSNGDTSEVYMFSHRERRTKHSTTYVRLQLTSNYSITLTRGHYMYTLNSNGNTWTSKSADQVEIGDRVLNEHGELISVKDIVVERLEAYSNWGLYNPHTYQGDIMVNGIWVSTFNKQIDSISAHALLFPVRAMFRSTGLRLSTFDSGYEWLRRCAAQFLQSP